MGMSDWPNGLNRTDLVAAKKFASIYILWSALWVVGSDYVMHVAMHGPNTVWRIESYKGLIYVLVSGFILFMAVRERDWKYKRERIQTESMLRSLRHSGLIGIYEWARWQGHRRQQYPAGSARLHARGTPLRKAASRGGDPSGILAC